MARKEGSVSKMIHFKTRNRLDIQKICDTNLMLKNTKNPPRDWLLRLVEISRNLPYIVSTKNLDIKAKQFILSEYITPELELKDDAPKDLIFEKPGPRDNDCLKYEIEEFIQNAFHYYMKFWDDEQPHSYIRIRQEAYDLRMLAKRGLKNCREWHYHKLFLLDDGKTGNFQPIQPDFSFNNTADIGITERWHSSWCSFWRQMLISINEMIEQLNESKFYFKLKTGDKKMEHKREFERWLEKGLDEFLEPTNRKMTNDETKINYLKYLILSKSDVEK